ncbi:hypothetical protein HDE_04344 [Halotydeus destructor]|nr:hypothetical protein HDE_04344 [Halotydeus destructor]
MMKQWLACLVLLSFVCSSLSRIIDTPTDVKEHIDSLLSTARPQALELFEYEMMMILIHKDTSAHFGGRLVFEFQSNERNSIFELDAKSLDEVRNGNQIRTFRIPIEHRKLKSIKATFIAGSGFLHLTKVKVKPLFVNESRRKRLNGLCANFYKDALTTNQSYTEKLDYCETW